MTLLEELAATGSFKAAMQASEPLAVSVDNIRLGNYHFPNASYMTTPIRVCLFMGDKVHIEKVELNGP
jgi:hypothetical protein